MYERVLPFESRGGKAPLAGVTGSPSTWLALDRGSISRGLRSLGLSVGINLLALVFAVAVVWRGLLVSPE